MSQRESEWKQLFKKREWLKNDEIVTPSHYLMTLTFSSGVADVQILGEGYFEGMVKGIEIQPCKVMSQGAALAVTSKLISVDSKSHKPEVTFVLWEDLQCVNFVHDGSSDDKHEVEEEFKAPTEEQLKAVGL